ncbi:AraC family transcriptional regulator [Diplocloster modestus]|uniref:AraC family transcriptional regulator n=1 Tax=Diplocloster modestus TaxID=2850322 RepID=A0ABS6KC79_9FIRM|nr:AraC family transcriptional regulator [Diplocloster modestus]MBU9728115.1 AraC family transcriptional regulator [Diplocloster modestus]
MSKYSAQKPPFIIHYCGSEVCSPKHQFGPAVRKHYLLHYINSGQGWFSLGDKSYHMQAGWGFLICPNTMVTYLADETDPWEYSWVGFSGQCCEDILENIGLSASLPVYTTIDPEKSAAYMRQILESKYLNAGREFAIAGAFLSFLSTVKGNIRRPEDSELNDTAALATDYIFRNFSYDISVDDVAHAACVSRATLYRVFKECFGVSVQQYLMDVRISTAAEMLSTTEYSINEIVYSCGFSNYQYFIRLFQKKKGISPSQYRNHFRIRNFGYDSCPDRE